MRKAAFGLMAALVLAGCATTAPNTHQADMDSMNARMAKLEAQLAEKEAQIAKMENQMGEDSAALRQAESDKRMLSEKLDALTAQMNAPKKKASYDSDLK